MPENGTARDICFVPDGNYGAFLERNTGKTYPPGDFLDMNGRCMGRHSGAVRYTIGQRRGVGLSADQRLYVIRKDMKENTVTVGPESALYTSGLIAGDVNWIAYDALTEPIRATVQTRYRQRDRSAVITPLEDGTIQIVFDQQQRAAAPGQAVVIYCGDTVLGGGTILRTLP